MKIEELQNSLKEQQDAFNTVVLRPNTLERNIELATHRNEIGRLNKLIAKAARA